MTGFHEYLKQAVVASGFHARPKKMKQKIMSGALPNATDTKKVKDHLYKSEFIRIYKSNFVERFAIPYNRRRKYMRYSKSYNNKNTVITLREFCSRAKTDIFLAYYK